jgi:hypothetical protein
MRKTLRFSIGLALVGVIALAGLGPGVAHADVNRWNAMTSPGFTQVFVRVDVTGQPPCQQEDFVVSGDSHAECIGEGVAAYHTFANVDLGWQLPNAFAGHFPLPPNDLMVGALVQLSGERTSPTLFVVSGSVYEGGYPLVATTEVAVFRFSGDATIFDGVEAAGVADLVSLGLIEAGDVLAVEQFTGMTDIDIEVDVTDLGDQEIILFATSSGPIPPHDVPATTFAGVVVLVLVMLGMGARAVHQASGRR